MTIPARYKDHNSGLETNSRCVEVFKTRHHYIVPEFEPNQQFILNSTKVIDEYKEAKALGIQTHPVILGRSPI
ncbi:5044_t:CDS:2 [Ambispora leptoticha]|uniref:5044_t:CDS:1 n=1 Tax=Ambispora leptoticha TaxID=144679 RepID=A0A9N8YR56_9GLOM|nr:5044_t:CDS:2 [Ambispora leptoticha]